MARSEIGIRMPGVRVQGGRERWDVFCRVVDNFGDVGVAWRLARCLAREHGKRVRLFLDDLTVARPPAPGRRSRPTTVQRIDCVDVWRWDDGLGERESCPWTRSPTWWWRPSAAIRPSPTCSPWPRRAPMPRWINLEYLSAEEWVEGEPRAALAAPALAPLTRHFFFPGFTARTGGLLRERDLLDAPRRVPGRPRGAGRVLARARRRRRRPTTP